MGLRRDIGAKAGQFVAQAKVIAIAGVIATFFGLAGVLLLAGAIGMLLYMWMPLPAALAVTAVGFLAVASIALWVGVNPSKADGVPDGVDDGQGGDPSSIEAALGQMTDLPMEVARKIISERPIAALAVFSGFGVLIARRPEIAIRLVERLIARFT